MVFFILIPPQPFLVLCFVVVVYLITLICFGSVLLDCVWLCGLRVLAGTSRIQEKECHETGWSRNLFDAVAHGQLS
jgi:hypothetical protein